MKRREPPEETFERPSRATLDQYDLVANNVLDAGGFIASREETRHLASIVRRLIVALREQYDDATERRRRRR